MPTVQELQAQILGELGRQFAPSPTLNAIGRPLFDTARAEIGDSAAQALQRLNNVLNTRGLIGSGIELQNRQDLEKLRATREDQALRDTLSTQNTLGLNEFQSGRQARLSSLLGLLESGQRSELQTAQQAFQERLAALDAQTRAQLADKELTARNAFAQFQAQLQRDEALRREALEQRLQEQQARSLAALLAQQQQFQASAANAAGFVGGIAGLDRPFNPAFDILGGVRPHAESNPGPLQGLNPTANQPQGFGSLGAGVGAQISSSPALPGLSSYDPSAIVNSFIRGISPFQPAPAIPAPTLPPLSFSPGQAPQPLLQPGERGIPLGPIFSFAQAQQAGNVAPGRNPVNPFTNFIDTPFRTPFTPSFAPISTSLFGPSAPGATAANPLPLFGSAGFVSAPGSRTNPFTLAFSRPFGA